MRVWSCTVTGGYFLFYFFHISAHHKVNEQCTVFPALGAPKAPGARKGKAVPAMSLSRASNSAGDRKKAQSCAEL